MMEQNKNIVKRSYLRFDCTALVRRGAVRIGVALGDT